MSVLRTVASTVGKTLGLSALAGLPSEGASQLVKKITGGQVFQVPKKELYRLAMMSDLLKCHFDQKIFFFFSLDFKTMLTKH